MFQMTYDVTFARVVRTTKTGIDLYSVFCNSELPDVKLSQNVDYKYLRK